MLHCLSKLFYLEVPLRVCATSQAQTWPSARLRWWVSACRAICSSSVNSNRGWRIYLRSDRGAFFFFSKNASNSHAQIRVCKTFGRGGILAMLLIPYLQPRWWLSAVNSFGLDWRYTSLKIFFFKIDRLVPLQPLHSGKAPTKMRQIEIVQ